MGNTTDRSGESKLRGGTLQGPEQKSSVDHEAHEKARDTDAVLRVNDDGEEDTLYDDGLEVEDDTPTIVNTDGRNNVR